MRVTTNPMIRNRSETGLTRFCTEACNTKIFVAEIGKAVEERKTELESKKSRFNLQSYGRHQANT